MMRVFRVLLAIVLLGASPPPVVPSPDGVPELVGTWTCRNPAGVVSTVAYRIENGTVLGDEKTPGERAVVHDRFQPDPGGGWRVGRDTAYGGFSGYGPAWTTGPWVITDRNKHGTEIRYERVGDGTLWRVFSIAGRPYAGEVCAKGDAPPDPALCAVTDLPPSVLHAMEPDTPRAALESRIQGTVDVLVSLDAAGRVVNAVIEKSASVVLNDASLTAARGSTYRPALRDCKPVASEYTFTVEYSMR